MEANEMLIDGPAGAPTIVLAHGAGAPMDSPFMETVSRGLASEGLRVVRFELPYMRERRRRGTRRPPDRPQVLLRAWEEAAAAVGDPCQLALGGKSLGGRIASLSADRLGARALVCFGYPFHPPGKPDTLRTAHLATLRTPTLILQGERDPLGSAGEVPGYELSAAVRLHWLADGDHSFVPRKRSGRTEGDNLAEAVRVAAGFLRERFATP